MKKIGTFITVLVLTFTIAGISEAKAATTYTYSGTEQQLINYLIQLIEQLQARIELQNRNSNLIYSGYYGPAYNNDGKNIIGKARPGGRSSSSSNDDEPDVTTESARDIGDNEAELNGEVDMNDFNNGEVFFVYGQDEDQVEDIEDDYDEYRDIDEDGDDLQVVLLDSDLDGSDSYSLDVYNLEEDEEYFYQICVGYEDEDDDDTITCGGVEDFETDGRGGSNNDDEPDVITQDAENIEDDEAELHGEVDMNDFDDGLVFFVYGEDESQVEDIEDDYDTYSDIDEDGDDLQKMQVDSSLDGYRTYWETAWGLDDDTDYYFQICVEFEDEDNDDKIICGGVEDFRTDN